jgi:hypothetical protein
VYSPGANSRLRYEYDFGDGWEDDILVEEVLPLDTSAVVPVYLAGKRACPTEDVGGVWGYARFLEALADPLDEEHQEMREWIGGDFDAEAFNLGAVNAQLRSVR